MSQNLLTPTSLPSSFSGVEHLEDFMSLPTERTIEDLAAVEGDIAILGVGGKMGVTLARLIKRVSPDRRVIGVSRFSDEGVREKLEAWGVETISCDLLDLEEVSRLPRVQNVIYMAGLKFDYRGREDFLWAMNTHAPGNVAQVFAGGNIVALSTIHVYPWSNPKAGGVRENVPPTARPGEYANSVVGRERTFQYFSRLNGTKGRNVRFVYAIDMRYGVFQEIADWVMKEVPIPLATGSVNVMWQGDAINQFARLLRHGDSPMTPINIGAPYAVSVRSIAERLGEALQKKPIFVGEESDDCLVVNCDAAAKLLGNPVVTVDTMVDWVAGWVADGGPTLGKPSKFQVRDGIF